MRLIPKVRVIPPRTPPPPVRPGWPEPPREIHYVEYQDRPSLLSSESSSNSYRGLINLSVILLIFTNARLVVENLSKYGVRFLQRPMADLTMDLSTWPATSIALVIQVCVLAVVGVQWMGSRDMMGTTATMALSIAVITLEVVVPPWMVMHFEMGPDRGIAVLMMATIFMMKLVSYVHVNHNLRCADEQRRKIAERRQQIRGGKKAKAKTPPAPARSASTGYNSIVGGTLSYPENISVRNMYHFLMLPTLVYQLSYPRTDRPIRRAWLARRIGELVFFSSLIMVLVDQYIQPTLINALPPMKANDLIGMVERLLKLAVPNLYVWLLGFYCFFHLWLNILAELFHFADRKFYADWWNATTVGHFWSLWNMPVHHWIAAHVFQPCIRNGLSKFHAFIISFFVSALFHEYAVAFPFKSFKLWAFFGMMSQVPLVYITQGMRDKQAGNVIFWLSITLGQPFAILMYYRDYVLQSSVS